MPNNNNNNYTAKTNKLKNLVDALIVFKYNQLGCTSYFNLHYIAFITTYISTCLNLHLVI